MTQLLGAWAPAPSVVTAALAWAASLPLAGRAAFAAAWVCAIAGALEALAAAVQAAGEGACGRGLCCCGSGARPRIRDSAARLAAFAWADVAYSGVNKATTALFVWHAAAFAAHGGCSWALPAATPAAAAAFALGAVVDVAALFVAYDAFYYWLHRALHAPALYGAIHKHHHRQTSPFRGNADAINVHPVEFALGEYLHLAAAALVRPHAASLLLFVLAGGVLASLNHTRFDARLASLWQVRWHDVHHARNTRANYSQYTSLWDRLFGSFVPYAESDAAAELRKAA
jgi:sterol desaturase/sphingolipid hydroxylase (fatty acid hydroxylase superfamily)